MLGKSPFCVVLEINEVLGKMNFFAMATVMLCFRMIGNESAPSQKQSICSLNRQGIPFHSYFISTQCTWAIHFKPNYVSIFAVYLHFNSAHFFIIWRSGCVFEPLQETLCEEVRKTFRHAGLLFVLLLVIKYSFNYAIYLVIYRYMNA